MIYDKTLPGSVKRNTTLGCSALNRILDPTNLIKGSANSATKAVADGLATSSVFLMLGMLMKGRVYSMNIGHLHSIS